MSDRTIKNRGLGGKVLSLLLSNPTKIYSNNDIAKQFNVSPSAAGNALSFLTNKGQIERIAMNTYRALPNATVEVTESIPDMMLKLIVGDNAIKVEHMKLISEWYSATEKLLEAFDAS